MTSHINVLDFGGICCGLPSATLVFVLPGSTQPRVARSGAEAASSVSIRARQIGASAMVFIGRIRSRVLGGLHAVDYTHNLRLAFSIRLLRVILKIGLHELLHAFPTQFSYFKRDTPASAYRGTQHAAVLRSLTVFLGIFQAHLASRFAVARNAGRSLVGCVPIWLKCLSWDPVRFCQQGWPRARSTYTETLWLLAASIHPKQQWRCRALCSS